MTDPKTNAILDSVDQRAYFRIETKTNFALNNSLEFLARKLHEEFHFTHVICLSEEEMIRASLLRRQLNINHGQDYESTLRFRDKFIMKSILQKANLKVPHFASIESSIDLFEFIEKHGYPVVVKPRRGYGSVNTSVIKSVGDLEKFCETGFGDVTDGPLDMMVESFVKGQMYHIDGLFYKNQARLICPSRYVNTVVNFTENNFIAGYSLQKSELTLRIQIFVKKCIEALDGPETFPFHAEVWVDDKDELVFCEVASRAGGGGIPTQILSLYGVNLLKTHTQFQADEPITLETKDILWNEREQIIPESVGWIFIYPRIGKVIMPKLCQEDYVLSYEPFAHTGQVYSNRKSCADAVCNFLVQGKDEETCEKNIHRIYEWFTNNSKWEPI